MRTFFSEDEMKVIGEYPSTLGFFGKYQPKYPKYNRPVSPRENFELTMKGETPYWLTNLQSDCNLIHPLALADNAARAYGGTDAFGIEWQMEALTGAPMVKPGTRRLSDLDNWEKELIWPDLKTIDWEKDVKEHYQNLPEDRPNIFLIVNGYFERIADLTSFEDAFCYLIEEEEELNAFFSKLTQWHIELAEIAKKYYHADMILMHDDMGTQNSTFFSTEMYKEIMQPHYQAFNKAIHEMGMYTAVHSCGHVEAHIPEFINSGFQMWEAQYNANDCNAMMKNYGEKLGQMELLVVAGQTEKEAYKAIDERLKGVGATGHYMCRLADQPDRYIQTTEYMYKKSRKIYDALYQTK